MYWNVDEYYYTHDHYNIIHIFFIFYMNILIYTPTKMMVHNRIFAFRKIPKRQKKAEKAEKFGKSENKNIFMKCVKLTVKM